MTRATRWAVVSAGLGALVVLGAGCSKAVLTPEDYEVRPPVVAPEPPASRNAIAARKATEYLGTPYVWSGSSPSGFDCSGLVSYVYAQVGVSIPHNAAQQYRYGTPVARDELQPGDLVAAHGSWATPIAYYLLSKDVAVERFSVDWTLEVLQVVGVPRSATTAATPHPRRTFLVARAGDEPTLEAIRQKTAAAGASAELTVVKRFDTTTVYEVRLVR